MHGGTWTMMTGSGMNTGGPCGGSGCLPAPAVRAREWVIPLRPEARRIRTATEPERETDLLALAGARKAVPIWTAAHELWAHVLLRAIRDTQLPFSADAPDDHRADALRWFAEASDGVGGARWVCELFGLDVDAVRAVACADSQPDPHELTLPDAARQFQIPEQVLHDWRVRDIGPLWRQARLPDGRREWVTSAQALNRFVRDWRAHHAAPISASVPDGCIPAYTVLTKLELQHAIRTGAVQLAWTGRRLCWVIPASTARVVSGTRRRRRQKSVDI